MRIDGKRIKRTRFIHTEDLVVAVEIELVIPVDDPSEPCLEAETVDFLREVKEHAEQHDISWLQRHSNTIRITSVKNGVAPNL